jgi:aspartate/methionine/tyrosine aminotransferase
VTQTPHRIEAVQAPVIPEVAELIAAHPGTISLGQGVVNYGPPTSTLERIQKFLSQPVNHKYQHVQGIPELITAITQKLESDNGVGLIGRDIVVTAGSNMGFLNAILAITDPGDEVILLRPFFFNQEMALTIAGCTAVVVDTDENYQPDLEKIAAAITQRTRAVVTISPNNPTGAVYSRQMLTQINALCGGRGVYHISDEAYEHFTYAGTEHFSPAAIVGGEGHTIALFSLSKGFGFASWRIGYMVAPHKLTTSIKKIQDTNLICPPVISQHAALATFEAGRAYCEPHVRALSDVREMTLELLGELGDRIVVPHASGAFYFLIRVASDLAPMKLVEELIKQFGVAVIPGTTFGVSDACTLRIAYGALDKDGVAEGLGRLTSGLKKFCVVGGLR